MTIACRLRYAKKLSMKRPRFGRIKFGVWSVVTFVTTLDIGQKVLYLHFWSCGYPFYTLVIWVWKSDLNRGLPSFEDRIATKCIVPDFGSG
jgi:hypothetical protein